MHSVDRRYSIVFNGEIYNYRELRQDLWALAFAFRTGSDTEVLLACWAQWGTDCLKRLIGMFAFALFDRRDKVGFETPMGEWMAGLAAKVAGSPCPTTRVCGMRKNSVPTSKPAAAEMGALPRRTGGW